MKLMRDLKGNKYLEFVILQFDEKYFQSVPTSFGENFKSGIKYQKNNKMSKK